MRKLNWGLIGGGEGSQIGEAHRMGARMHNHFAMVAGALDADPDKGRSFAGKLGIENDRAYGNWQEMLEGESDRSDRIELVTVATPNATHFKISAGFLQAGINVLCEKPLTMTIDEADRLKALSEETGTKLFVNFGYSGYPMIRQARAMVADGSLGKIRLMVAEFAHGFHADATDADNPRVRWRYDPEQAGVSSIVADCGIHALHLATYISGQSVDSLSAHFESVVGDRKLEDDAAVQCKMSAGAICRLWSSAVAVGHMHGLNIQVFGEQGGVRWHQEQPNQLHYTPLNGPTQILERGQTGLSADAVASSRVTIGHTEGFLGAISNIYKDIFTAMNGDESAQARIPGVDDGVAMVRFVHRAAESAGQNSRWLNIA